MATAKTSEEKMVEICLFKDNKAYTEDVFAGVNGRTFQIRRGEPVKVPECVAEVLRNSQMQDNHAIALMGELQNGSDW